MLNSFRNMGRGSKLKYIGEAALYAALIYGMIYIRSSTLVVQKEVFLPAIEVSTEKGFHINGLRIPLENLEEDHEITLPYDSVRNAENSLNFLVDDENMKVEILTKTAIGYSLEARLDSTAEDREGKDGLSINGSFYPDYTIRLTKKNEDGSTQQYTIILTP